ncbi:PREDICTED: laminin subunit gamma-1-like [Chinchilla lanigera]|uniref:laminin subunit gamma-1-like n=1 Tax=Chinchilla lanigera TaxID=34839 RepID=UPI000695C789|nr:PREDICTED: laminin subunit gamma-1-like [Chinchilla lanigera]
MPFEPLCSWALTLAALRAPPPFRSSHCPCRFCASTRPTRGPRCSHSSGFPQGAASCPQYLECPRTTPVAGAALRIPAHSSSGAVTEVPCRAGSYCRPQTGVPQLCPGGFVCPVGSSSYLGPGQRCLFPYYCPLGSAHPRTCPGGSEALNRSGLRLSAGTCCRQCEAGTYHSQALDALPCQPCPAGFSCPQGSESYHSQPCPVGHYCPPGMPSPKPCPAGTYGGRSQAKEAEDCRPCPAGTFSALTGQAGCLPCGRSAFSPPGSSSCTCWGLNRVFQKSDGSCICQTGHVSYDHGDLGRGQDSDGKEDCQPQVAERCPPGDVRLAATHKCVSPQTHDCASFCHPGGGELSVDLGICQCLEYVSSEELCDVQCLTRAPQLSLVWGPSRELILSVKREAGDIIQRVSPSQERLAWEGSLCLLATRDVGSPSPCSCRETGTKHKGKARLPADSALLS